MILTPGILALLLGSGLMILGMVFCSAVGVHILQGWSPGSGSPHQIALERKTYLISTILSWVLAFEVLSLLLFVYLGEDLHTLFVGAMCGAGTFNVNDYGYPALVLKIVNTVLCGIWLILNQADNQAVDYPLVRRKYRLLPPLTLLVIFEGVMQLEYFRLMEPNLITSCCGTLFSEGAQAVTGDLLLLPPALTQTLFYTAILLHLRLGWLFLRSGKAAGLFAWLSAALLPLSFIAVISFVSVYYYQQPMHHCPFCVMQADYGFVGYPLYVFLLLGGITGTGMGALQAHRTIASLRTIVPALQRNLCRASMAGYAALALLTLYPMVFSSFRLKGY